MRSYNMARFLSMLIVASVGACEPDSYQGGTDGGEGEIASVSATSTEGETNDGTETDSEAGLMIIKNPVLTEADLPLDVLEAMKADWPSAREIVGTDNRRSVLDTTTHPYSSVVRIYTDWDTNGLKGHCTGNLIEPDAVLTAAHCVYNGVEANGYAYSVKVIPSGYIDSTDPNTFVEPFGSTFGKKLFVPREYIQKEGSHWNRIPYDYAVIRLKTPLDRATNSWVLTKSDPLYDRTVLAAYHWDIDSGRQMMLSTDKVRRVNSNGTFNHYTDAYGTSSGGGITSVNEWIDIVFAINSTGATLSSGANYNIAVLINEENEFTIYDWCTQSLP